jgi:uncharacterized membrane protein
MSLPGNSGTSRLSRYVFVGSLALNLVLAGAAGAMALQHARAVPPLEPVVGIKHSIEYRFNRVAASLPESDARIIRAEFRAEAVQLLAAETQMRLSKAAVRESLRAQPFDPAAMRTAMAETNVARDHFYELVHDTVATATAKMSPAGRQMLADWPMRQSKTVITQ